MKLRHVVAAAAVAAASFGGAAEAEAQYLGGGIWQAQTNEMYFEYIDRNATFSHELRLYTYAMGQAAEDRATYSTIFTVPPDMVGATATVGVNAGSWYVLGLFVPNNGTLFFSDGFAVDVASGTELPGENPNYEFSTNADGSIRVAIEDTRDVPIDEDFNDMIVDVSTVPEPGTVALLATGLLGLGGFGVARRRKTVEA